MKPQQDTEDRALGDAIRFRLMVHAALERDDWSAVSDANRKADAAYLRLSPVQAGVYIKWMQQFKVKPGELVLAGEDA